MRANEFIKERKSPQQVDEFLPVLGAAAAGIGRAAIGGAQLAGRGIAAAGQLGANALKTGAQAVGGAIKTGAQAVGQGIKQVGQVANAVGQVGSAMGQPTPQEKAAMQNQQNTMAGNLTQLKSLGINLNPEQAKQALTKADSGQALNMKDKDNITAMAPAVADIISNPQTAGQFRDLVKKVQGV
jgi:hypothetical protein